MPIYEFHCLNCGTEFEIERKIKDRTKPCRCKSCGSKKTEQLISHCEFSLQGGDWASTGYGVRSTEKGKK